MSKSRERKAGEVDESQTWPSRWADATVPGDSDCDDRVELGTRDVALLVGPVALAAVYGLLTLGFGANLLDTGQPWPGNAVAFTLLGALFLVSTLGTVTLYDDAERVGAGDSDWQPNPWVYVASGSILLLASRALQFAVDGQAVSDPAPVYAGTAVVTTAMAALVAGPIYLARRLRQT